MLGGGLCRRNQDRATRDSHPAPPSPLRNDCLLIPACTFLNLRQVALEDTAAAGAVEAIVNGIAASDDDDNHLVDPIKFSHCTVSDVAVTGPALPYLQKLALARKQRAAKSKKKKLAAKAEKKSEMAWFKGGYQRGRPSILSSLPCPHHRT